MIGRWIRRSYAALKSLRLTATVIVLLAALYVAGLFLPQKWMFGSRTEYDSWLDESLLYRALDITGFTEIYTSPLTLVLLGLFFINLLIVMAGRVTVMLKRSYINGAPAAPSGGAVRSSGSALIEQSDRPSEMAAGALEDAARRCGYYLRVPEHAGSLFTAVRNRYSPLGFLLFHLSFLFCLIGGLMVMYTRFSGDLVLTEGQAFEGDMAQFRKINREPKVLKALPSLALKLLDVHPVYDREVPSRLEATLLVFDGEETRKELINVNEPVRRGALTIHADEIGVSPLVEITGPSGRFMDGAYVALSVLSGQVDSFKFDTDPRYNFTVQFYPDYEVVDGLERTRSPELKNPVFHLAIDKEGTREFEGTVRPGQPVGFGIFTLTIKDIRYWVEFLVIREYGTIPLVIGFILASVGLVMRLVFYQRRIHILIEPAGTGSVIYMDGRSDFFPIAFREEIERFMNAFREALAGGMR